jgi:transposase-like protein
MSEDKRGISALPLMDKIGVAYQTAWSMCHKIRSAMGERDEKYMLKGKVELDDAFFGSSTVGGKRGRGTEKTAVLTSVSLSSEGKPEFVKMQVADRVDGESVKEFAKDSIAEGSEIITDGLHVYSPLSDDSYTLTQKIFDPKNVPEHLHWIHIIISNVKSFIAGTFHGLDSLHLQRYLNEFSYRFNRRWFSSGVFSRLVSACATSSKITYHELIG